MANILFVGIGGFIGAVMRYKIGGLILHNTSGWKFPASTLIVNVAGCLIAGLLTGLIETRDVLSPTTRLFLFTGFLGGFTTFSAFGLETVSLLQRNEFMLAGINIGASVFLGIAALWLGIKIFF